MNLLKNKLYKQIILRVYQLSMVEQEMGFNDSSYWE